MSNSHRETKSIRIFRKIRFTHLHDIYDCTKSSLSLHTEATISSEFEVKFPAHLFSVFLCRLSGHFLRHFRLLRPDEHNICYDRTGSLWYLRDLSTFSEHPITFAFVEYDSFLMIASLEHGVHTLNTHTWPMVVGFSSCWPQLGR